jgi:O-antigen ligase
MGCLSFIPYVRQVFILFIFKFSGLDLGYTSRILVLQEDDLRTSIFNEALNVYYEYWFQGMGYMNFMKWYGEKFGISELTANGTEIVGMNLHNSFQTWALEGGIFAIIIIIYIMYVYIKRSIYKIKISQNQFEKNFHTVGLINIVSFIIFASYHQLHQNIIFFILLGIVLKRKSVIKSNSLEA